MFSIYCNLYINVYVCDSLYIEKEITNKPKVLLLLLLLLKIKCIIIFNNNIFLILIIYIELIIIK